MWSIDDKKKFYFDFLSVIYVFLLIMIGYLFSFSSFFAFATGIDIGESVEGYAKGVSINEVLAKGTERVKSDINLALGLIITSIIFLLILAVIYFYFLKKQNKNLIEITQGINLILWFFLFVIIGSLTDLVTRPVDYETLRVWGISFFGVITILSVIIITLIQAILLFNSYAKDKIDSISSTESLTNSIIDSNIYLISFGIMFIQNLLLFTLSAIQISLILDMIGIGILGVFSMYVGTKTKETYNYYSGILLSIWVLLSFIWRNQIGLFSSSFGSFSSDSSSSSLSSVLGVIFIGSLFLGGGLYFLTLRIITLAKKVKFPIYGYIITNIVSSFLLIISPGYGLYLKLFFVPIVGILLYLSLIFVVYTHKSSSK